MPTGPKFQRFYDQGTSRHGDVWWSTGTRGLLQTLDTGGWGSGGSLGSAPGGRGLLSEWTSSHLKGLKMGLSPNLNVIPYLPLTLPYFQPVCLTTGSMRAGCNAVTQYTLQSPGRQFSIWRWNHAKAAMFRM